MEVVSAFDIATRLTGWCSGTGETVPECGAFPFDQVGTDLGALGAAFWSALDMHFARRQPTRVVYEAPILITGKTGDPARTDKLLPLRKIYGMGLLLETYCLQRGVPCNEVTISAVKKEVTGNRHADKDAMVAVAARCGLQLPTGPAAKDAADAWGAWLIGIRHYNRSVSASWDRRIHSRRGDLL